MVFTDFRQAQRSSFEIVLVLCKIRPDGHPAILLYYQAPASAGGKYFQVFGDSSASWSMFETA